VSDAEALEDMRGGLAAQIFKEPNVGDGFGYTSGDRCENVVRHKYGILERAALGARDDRQACDSVARPTV